MAKSKSKTPRITKKSVCFPADLFARGKNRAAGLNRNFSNYLQTLVQEDLAKAASKETATT